MIKINLLPFRAARKRENIKRQISIYALVVILTLTVIIYLFYNSSSNLSRLQAQETGLKNELASYQKELDEIKELEKKIQQVRTKLEVIDKLQTGKTGPVLLLADIAAAVPAGKLWLTSLNESGGALSLTGTAMDYETVALFMNNLERTEQITAPPELLSVTKRSISEFNLTVSDFDMKCVTAAAAPVEEKKPAKKQRKK